MTTPDPSLAAVAKELAALEDRIRAIVPEVSSLSLDSCLEVIASRVRYLRAITEESPDGPDSVVRFFRAPEADDQADWERSLREDRQEMGCDWLHWFYKSRGTDVGYSIEAMADRMARLNAEAVRLTDELIQTRRETSKALDQKSAALYNAVEHSERMRRELAEANVARDEALSELDTARRIIGQLRGKLSALEGGE